VIRRQLAAIVLVVTSLLLVGIVGAEAPAAAQPGHAIHIVRQGGALLVDVRDARPTDVLQALGAQCRVSVTVQGKLPGRITRAFTVASVEDAVREVVRGYSVALVFGRAGEGAGVRLRDVRIISVWSAPLQRERTAPTPVVHATRLDAVRALAGTGDISAVADLSRVLVEDAAAIVRARAAIALGELGMLRAVRPILAALGDPSPLVRMQAIRALGRTDPEAAVTELGAVLISDPDPGVRRVAARTLGRLGGRAAQMALEAATGDADEPVRRDITEALARSMRRQQ
jgi:hypothetical protein